MRVVLVRVVLLLLDLRHGIRFVELLVVGCVVGVEIGFALGFEAVRLACLAHILGSLLLARLSKLLACHQLLFLGLFGEILTTRLLALLLSFAEARQILGPCLFVERQLGTLALALSASLLRHDCGL